MCSEEVLGHLQPHETVKGLVHILDTPGGGAAPKEVGLGQVQWRMAGEWELLKEGMGNTGTTATVEKTAGEQIHQTKRVQHKHQHLKVLAFAACRLAEYQIVKRYKRWEAHQTALDPKHGRRGGGTLRGWAKA